MATITHGDVPTSSSLPYADRVRSVASDQPFYWLASVANATMMSFMWFL